MWIQPRPLDLCSAVRGYCLNAVYWGSALGFGSKWTCPGWTHSDRRPMHSSVVFLLFPMMGASVRWTCSRVSQWHQRGVGGGWRRTPTHGPLCEPSATCLPVWNSLCLLSVGYRPHTGPVEPLHPSFSHALLESDINKHFSTLKWGLEQMNILSMHTSPQAIPICLSNDLSIGLGKLAVAAVTALCSSACVKTMWDSKKWDEINEKYLLYSPLVVTQRFKQSEWTTNHPNHTNQWHFT